MAYLIDGHNLIGRLRDLRLDDPNDEARLVERLRAAMARQGKRCTVIFDQGLPGGRSRDLSTPSVHVVFAHAGTTADAIILERIRAARDPGSLIVVSGDQAIIHAAKARRMRVVAPAEFTAVLSAPQAPNEDDPNPRVSPDEVEYWLHEFGSDPDDSR